MQFIFNLNNKVMIYTKFAFLLKEKKMTQEELAQLVGASRETVNKALADFAGRGWVRLEPRAVVVLDVERLSKRGR